MHLHVLRKKDIWYQGQWFLVVGNILGPKFACMHTPVTKRLDYAFNPLVFIQNFCFPANNLMRCTNVCNLYECKLLTCIHRLMDSILSLHTCKWIHVHQCIVLFYYSYYFMYILTCNDNIAYTGTYFSASWYFLQVKFIWMIQMKV